MEIEIAKEDEDLILLLINKLACAKQALKNPAKGWTEDERDFFYKSTIDAIGQYQWLYNDTWNRLADKYNLPNGKRYALMNGKIHVE